MNETSLRTIALLFLAFAGPACTNAPDSNQLALPGPGEAPQPELGTSRIQGQVVDADGAAVDNLLITLCAKQCLTERTDFEGGFVFENVHPGMWVLENTGAPNGDAAGTSRFFDLVEVHPAADILFEDALVVPRIEAPRTNLDCPEAFAIGSLDVAFCGDDLQPPPSATEATFGGVELPPEQWPTGGLDDWWVLSAHAFAAWDLEPVDGFLVTQHLDTPLPRHVPVFFLVADYEEMAHTGKWKALPAQLSEDGLSILSLPGAGPERATLWMAAVGLNLAD